MAGVDGNSIRCSGCTLSFRMTDICSVRSDMDSGARTRCGKRPFTTTVEAAADPADRARRVQRPVPENMRPICPAAVLRAARARAVERLRTAAGDSHTAVAAYRPLVPPAASAADMRPVAADTARKQRPLLRKQRRK